MQWPSSEKRPQHLPTVRAQASTPEVTNQYSVTQHTGVVLITTTVTQTGMSAGMKLSTEEEGKVDTAAKEGRASINNRRGEHISKR